MSLPSAEWLRAAGTCCLGALAATLLATASWGGEVPAEGRDFGAPLSIHDAQPLAEVLAAPERYADGPVLVSGRIAEVCQRKGCWTILRDGEASLRVRFQDYGFFLPKDCQGDEAFVEGRLQVRTLSETEARHYAEETPGGDPASIVGPQREVGFLATGVRLSTSNAPR